MALVVPEPSGSSLYIYRVYLLTFTYILYFLGPRAGVARKRRDTRGRGGVCRANPVVLVTGARWAVTAAVAGAPTWCRVCLRPF